MGLRDIRRERGLTQEQVASLSGVDQGYISALELATDPNVGWRTVRRLCKALRVKPHELFPLDIKGRGARP